MSLSKHAKKRLQQRGISEEFVDVLIDFGFEKHARYGAKIIYLRQREQQMVRCFLGQAGFPNHYQNAYVVVNQDGCVITVGHRYRRVKHH